VTIRRTKKRIGVIIDAIHEPYQSGIWNGICHEAGKQGVDILSFAGTSQDGVDHFDAHYDVISFFAPGSDIDGVIVFSGSITEHHGKEFTTGLCRAFQGIPLVCVSEKVEDFPVIMVENAPGIEQIVHHFAVDHHLRNVAFIKGPAGHAEADARFNAYCRGLENNGLPFNPALVFSGSFIARDGARAVRELLDGNQPFDGIICVNDDTARGVLEELQKQNRHVPGEVSVAGFDDVPEAENLEPALTTIRQPLFQIGVAATRNILDQIDGIDVPTETVLPTEPVFRRSCGCFSKAVASARAIHTHVEGLSLPDVATSISRLVLATVDISSPHFPGVQAFQESVVLLLEFLDSAATHPGSGHGFLNEVDRQLFVAKTFCDSTQLLTAILREMTVHLPSLFTDGAHLTESANLLQQGKVLVQENRNRNERQKYIAEAGFQRNINVVCQRIISSFEQRELLTSIADGLPELQVNSLTLALFPNTSISRNDWHSPEFSELMLGFNLRLGEVMFPRGETRIQRTDIFVDHLMDLQAPGNHIFMPLFHRDEYLGYVVLEFAESAPLFMYEEIRLHISSAVKSAMLLRKFKAQSMVDELTGVYNRRGFVTLARKLMDSAHASKTELMMFYADVDGLKGINDTFGHEHGDTIISGAARVLTETFRERDLIARIGGDEFVVVLLSQKIQGLEKKIRRRFAMLESRFNEKLNRQYQLSVSLGAAVCRLSENESLDTLMKRADADLFAKKRARKLSL
jgi:diguanylate cyclase (GGDEF)-like protein